MVNQTFSRLGLQTMGYQTREDGANNLLLELMNAIVTEAQNGKLFINFQIEANNWSLVERLVEKFIEHHSPETGITIINGRNCTPGYASFVEVRWF